MEIYRFVIGDLHARHLRRQLTGWMEQQPHLTEFNQGVGRVADALGACREDARPVLVSGRAAPEVS